MANEATIVNGDNDIHYFNILNQAIPKGTWMVLSADPRLATLHSSASQVPLGVAVEEVKAGDGQDKVAVRMRGIVDAVAVAAITLGDLVELSATANKVQRITASAATLSDADLMAILGRCLETASTDEKVNILLMCA
jgi:hypothetical protein